ncbi:UDP-glycosyltransferase 86A2-like [Apium graveolens]|uniref:UDP-glycosyltransferase 86A2-like n=1 Tax=Apium graveolens TaxID=4045 RepID=UPI003D7BDF70
MNQDLKPHAIFIAYPLQGHVNPSVHLARKLAENGFTITFINTQYVHHECSRARGNKDDDIFVDARQSGLDIRYVTISDGLPVAFDRSLNHDQFMAALLHVFSAHAEEAVENILKSGESVNCLIADTFFVWPAKVAKKFGLLYISYWTETALVFSQYYHMDLLRMNSHYDCLDARHEPIDYIPGVKSIEPKDMTSFLQATDTTTVCHQIIHKAFEDVRGADIVLCNTVYELESDTISALQSKIPFLAIGPIIPFGITKNIVPTSLWAESDCTQWLDTKPHGSVLYVSFGSYAHLRKTDLVEIANGLLDSNVSFVWVLRPDIVSSNDLNPLPSGFVDEMGDRGMIIKWCSQMHVLRHPAIGGFLSHCGWNSVMESVWSERPLLCFPLYTDQFTNRKLVVDDWKIGINLSDRRIVTSVEVSEKVNRLMDGKSSSKLRDSIKHLKQILASALESDGSSEKNVERFKSHVNAMILQKSKTIIENKMI